MAVWIFRGFIEVLVGIKIVRFSAVKSMNKRLTKGILNLGSPVKKKLKKLNFLAIRDNWIGGVGADTAPHLAGVQSDTDLARFRSDEYAAHVSGNELADWTMEIAQHPLNAC
ncbi:MAG: hypothetical protein ACO3RV_03880 [Luteolibacter sp.]